MIIDAHNHINPESWVKPLLKGEKVVTLFEGGVPTVTYSTIMYEIDERVEGMDRAGVDMTLLYRPSSWNNSVEECREVNDYIGGAVKKHPKRLIGTAHVPPFAGEKAADELRRCVNDLGFKAVHLGSSLKEIPLDSPELWPFYREVTRLDIPIVIHPSMARGYKHCMDYDLQRIIGREFDLMLGVTRLIYGGVLEEFPDLKVLFSHLGGGISGLKGRLRAVQPWVQHSDRMKQSFDAYFSKLYFDTAGFYMSDAEIRCALINIGTDNILFGTDYPADYRDYELVRQFKELVLGLLPDEADRKKVMEGNAAKLLKL